MMGRNMFWITSSLTIIFLAGVCGKSPTVYITEQCGKSVILTEQTIVELSPDTRPKLNSTSCRMNLNLSISSSNESGIVLSIQNIRLTPRISGACVDNKIDIYDGAEKLNKQDLCGMYLDQHTFATNSAANEVMGIELKSRDTVERKISFRAIVTPFHNAPCISSEFQCANSRCIDVELICNGNNNCGDNSDERNGLCGLLFLTTAAIIGIVLGVLAAMFCIPCLIFCLCCRKKRRQRVQYQRI